MMRRLLVLIVLAAGMGASVAVGQEQAPPVETKEQRDARMAWWREARFGMFIHWGLYAVPAGRWKGNPSGGEWIMHTARIPVNEYAQLAGQFNPAKFDAEQWVLLAKRAGMKYIVITAKHHDGFAMFRSQASAFNIHDATPFRRDPLKELAEACRKHGMKLGFYYSQAQDWHHPGGAAAGGHWDPAQDGDMDQYLRTVAAPQVREILSNYGPVAVLWWDTPEGMTRQRADLLRPLLDRQPGIITNNRLGGGYPGDSDTPEQFIPATGHGGRDWETCMTMNDTWGYRADDHNWKPTTLLLRNLIDIASKGGNYLLNVGPTAEGSIPPASAQRLEQIGQWMQANGEAIYGTSASPFRHLPWGRCTRKGQELYLHVFDWPADGRLRVPMANEVLRAHLLAMPDQALAVQAPAEDGVVVQLPPAAPDPIASVVVVEVDGAVQAIRLAVQQSPDGTIRLRAEDADLIGQTARLEGGPEVNVGWWTDANDYVQWPVRVREGGEFRAQVVYACEPTMPGSEYALEVGSQTLTGKVEATGGWGDYRTVDVGTLRIGRAGDIVVTLRATRKPGSAVMNLRNVTLTPVARQSP